MDSISDRFILSLPHPGILIAARAATNLEAALRLTSMAAIRATLTAMGVKAPRARREALSLLRACALLIAEEGYVDASKVAA